jgi:hypothetical protein
VTVALAPASYSPSQSVQATVVGTSTSIDLAAVSPSRWIAQGASLSVPLTVQALVLGVGLANQTINFAITRGSATLSSATATTNSAGFASVTASFTNLSGTIQASACVVPNNSPCATIEIFAVASSSWTLQTVSGAQQIVAVAQQFQPLVVRVTDGSSAQNPVMGVNVLFGTTLTALNSGGDQGPPILLGNSQALAATDQNGLASMTPSTGSVGACDLFINVSAGQSNAEFELESVPPMAGEVPEKIPSKAPTRLNQLHGGEENPL